MRIPGKKLSLIILIIALLAVLAIITVPLSTRFIHAARSGLQALSTSAPPANTSPNTPQPGEAAGPLISGNVPAFASSAAYPATNANDSSYDTAWRSMGAPAWLAYDLSKIPANRRNQVLLAWYNETGNYDHTLIGYPAYNMPQNYTIEINAAPGGGQAPTTGWVVKATIQGNHFHSRQHVIAMAGANWIRINVTSVAGSVENEDVELNMDVYDASTALADDWIFFGDSITAGAMDHQTLNGVASFAQLINARLPHDYPVQEGGGTGYLTSADGVKNLPTWLALFPGKYVGLSYGTNDALGCVNPATFYQNYVTMVQDVLHAGKIPLVPTIPWGRHPAIQRCAPALNAQISKLYGAFPQIIHGPNLWSFFQSHQNLISNDTIHPTDEGFGAYRQQWASTVLAVVYKA
jgi:lysophospholipase L1-like esterase